jgi:hypothetical protein
MKTLLILLAILIPILAVRAPAMEERRASNALYGPLSPVVIDRMLREHGLPASLFTVALRIPMELGGNNARENLMVIAWRDLPDKRQFEAVVFAQVRNAKTTVEQARTAVAAWHPVN